MSEPPVTDSPAPARAAAVASVYVDVPLPHLDQLFDYRIPEEYAASVTPGVKVRVRFAGRLVDAYVMAVGAGSQHEGRLATIERVVSPQPVLTEETAALFRAVADRWAGMFIDVARLAVPPRNAGAEKAAPRECPTYSPPTPSYWDVYSPGFATALAQRRGVRAVWSALPGEDWPRRLAEAAAASAAAGHGAVLVAPDVKDVARIAAALDDLVGAEGYVELHAGLGPQARYRRFLKCLRGEVRIAVGTRSAVYAPVADLGLIAIWDDGDDLYDEPRAPYPHTRDVAVLRAHRTGASVIVGGHTQSVGATSLIRRGWARPLRAPLATVRERMPRVIASGDDVFLKSDEAAHTARMPTVAIQAARRAVEDDLPVLVQVPRRGYLPSLACLRCHTPARCRHCGGPLALRSADDEFGYCRWCGKSATGWSCAVCGAHRFRAAIVGARRTAEEIGRMLPGVPVVQSAGDHVKATIDPGARLVICTPGAEPVVAGGYGAVLLLDGWALLSRAELSAPEEALRRWMNAAALARSNADGGRVVVMAPGAVPTVQALVRWDAPWLAEREYDERAALRFPPTVRMASLVGELAAIEDVTTSGLPSSADVLGPVDDPRSPGLERVLVRTPLSEGDELARSLRVAKATRSAKKASDKLTVKLDPTELL